MNKNNKLSTMRECPIEYLQYAQKNPELFAQEFLSFPSGSINPFFRDLVAVTNCVKSDLKNPMDESTYEFDPEWRCNDAFPRYMHIDLARTQDAIGISMSHTRGTVNIEKVTMSETGTKVNIEHIDMPLVEFDFTARLHARRDLGEKVFDFRQIIVILHEIERRGFNLKGGLITLDRFQSLLLMDILKDQGFVCALLSIDATTRKVVVDYSKDDYIRYEPIRNQPAAAWVDFREATTQKRIILPRIPMFDEVIDWITKEATESMWDGEKQKVFKMKVPGASDDLIQSVVGSYFNCQVNSEDQVLDSLDAEVYKVKTDDWYNSMPGMENETNEIRRGREPVQQNELGFYNDEFDLYNDTPELDGLI